MVPDSLCRVYRTLQVVEVDHMRHLSDAHRHGDHFHVHPMLGTFAVIATMLIAALIAVTVLATSAR